MDISILIPANNEVYLQKTIDDIISKAESDFEIIAVCDGYKPELKEHPCLKVIYNETALGQRQAVNQAARLAEGKYIFKSDAHCMFDEGFDVKLMEYGEYDWTIIPRMYVLDAENWRPKLHKRTDFMFFASPNAKEHPFRIHYYDKTCAKNFPNEYKAYKEAEWTKGDICDTMTCIGAGWLMNRNRFLELGGMDEQHGHWGQMGVELACKTWLSGGRMVVNKKTWFAHQWRDHAPWKLTQHQVDKAREYSIDLWMNNKWPLQKRPLSWLIEKFSPVPSWNGEFKKKTSDITLLYYTANRIPDGFRDKVIDQLKWSKLPIVSVSQKPLNLGENYCIGDIGVSLQNIYKQVYEGLKHVKTDYVALVEDDCLYVPEHFNFRPKTITYNLNRWLLHNDSDHVFSYRKRPVLSQCIAKTKVLMDCLAPRMTMEVPVEYSGEPGLFEKKLGLPEIEYETFETKEPNVVVCHNKNTSGRKLLGKDAEPRTNLAPWGNAEELLNILFKEEEMAKYGRGAKLHQQHSYIGSIIFNIDELMSTIIEYRDRRRPIERAQKRLEVIPPFIEKIAKGQIFTNEELTKEPYYDYLKSTGCSHTKSINTMRDLFSLYNNIKNEGVKAPLDGWRVGKEQVVIHRGWRRLFIMDYLHRNGIRSFPRVCVRLFKSIDLFRKYAPTPDVNFRPNSIHELAKDQFVQLGHKATDKYWVHGYTKWYDRHFNHLRNEKLKILEIGVFRGASLLLWKEAFPKSKVYGIDKNTAIWKELLHGKKDIKVFVGQQQDKKFLKEQVIPNAPFDIIIDDGSHWPKQQLATFEALWPHIKSGGFFVIEDLHGNYWDKMKGQNRIMTERIKKVVDEVNDGTEIRSLTSYYNITFIEKV